MSVIFFGVGKLWIASMDFGQGDTDVGDSSKPANWVVFRANANLEFVFNVTTFLPIVSRKSTVWKKASSIDSSQRIASLIIFFFLGMSVRISSYRLV